LVQWFETRTRKTLKLKYKLSILAIIFVILLIFAKPVLVSLARHLDVPNTNKTSDVMIVEGGPSLAEYVVMQAIKVYEKGLARHIVFVLHAYDLKPTIFGVPYYDRLVATALDSLGIPRDDFSIMLMQVTDPYTYNTAKALADSLPDISSILVFSDNFHIRRSYLAYKKIFEPRGVQVNACSMPIYLHADNWWHYANGWRRVVDEYIKLTFYRIKGYI